MQSPISMATSFSPGDRKKQALVSAGSVTQGINHSAGAGYPKERAGEERQELERDWGSPDGAMAAPTPQCQCVWPWA